MAQMIGAVHGVQNRQAPKRQKIERSSDDPRKPVIFEAHTGGELGAYIDEHKAKDAQIRAIPETIDLTEELDSQSAGPPPSADEIVCFGMFDGVRVNVQMIPFASSDNDFKLHGLGCWPILMCKTSPGYPKDQSSRDNPVINVHDGKGNIFGKLASPHGIAISKLISWQPLRAKLSTTFLQKRPLKGGETVGSPVSEAHPIQVLLYGRKSCANALVYRLQSFKLSLVHPPPSRIKKGLLYFNPYEALTSAEQTSMGLTAGGQSLFPHDVRTLEEVQAEVMNIFDSLGDVELLEEYPDPPFITTSLLKHQKQALSFMSLKEGKRLFSNSEPGNNTFWRKKRRANGQVFYKFLLFGHEQDREPGESRGGILADVMGLGKTLSILALAASTRADARDFEGEEVPPTDPGERKVFFQSRATLIICPLSVINNWVEQVSAHMDMDQVRIRVQHGSTRLTDPKALKDHDVVITTYHQIANEYSGRAYRGISPMSQINWFRIVLDEAHMIRTSKTQMAKSVCRLHAQRRWSVTGTPVQNRLEDLGSLLTFLRLEPVHDKASFGRYVSGPLKSTTDKHTLATLRCLVDSIALRRDKSKIDLPPRHDIRVDLEFSKEETRVHNTLRKDSENQVKAITKNKSGTVGKAYIHVLQSILRLRQACAHGKELLGEEDVRFLEGHDVDTAINLDAEEDDDPFGMKAKFSAEEVYRTVRLMLDTDACRCCMCSNVISPTDIDGSVSDGADGTFGYMSRCFDLICTDCINDFQAGVKKHETDPKAGYCPKCGQIIIAQAQFPLEAQEYENHIDEHLQSNDKSAASRGKKWHGTYSGPSTKVKRLIQMLNDDKYASQMAPGKPVIKSVIFSGWTQHLDLIEIALKANQTTFCRLDGRMDREARKRSLDRFALRDGGPTVILVSIAAGGLGLNLTRACKAYVMEPQYNPQAEAQAVDRVHRLGQTEEVTITRFIMKDSFEHKVIEVQDRKKQIATMTVDRKRAREAMTQQNKLIELKALFAPVPRSKPS